MAAKVYLLRCGDSYRTGVVLCPGESACKRSSCRIYKPVSLCPLGHRWFQSSSGLFLCNHSGHLTIHTVCQGTHLSTKARSCHPAWDTRQRFQVPRRQWGLHSSLENGKLGRQFSETGKGSWTCSGSGL